MGFATAFSKELFLKLCEMFHEKRSLKLEYFLKEENKYHATLSELKYRLSLYLRNHKKSIVRKISKNLWKEFSKIEEGSAWQPDPHFTSS